MLDMTLREIAAEAMAQEAHALSLWATRQATASWTRFIELANRDPELLAQSRERITLSRQRLAAVVTPTNE